MAIPADAPHPGNALLWMNYIMRPEVHAGLTNAVFYANPNLASLPFVKKEIAQNPTVFPSAEVLADMQVQTALPSAIRRLQTRFYTKLRTGL
jgi:putrescine transport system substrate-binding protein